MHLGDFSFDHEGEDEVAEPEVVYSVGDGMSRSARFFHTMHSMRMATQEEVAEMKRVMER